MQNNYPFQCNLAFLKKLFFSRTNTSYQVPDLFTAQRYYRQVWRTEHCLAVISVVGVVRLLMPEKKIVQHLSSYMPRHSPPMDSAAEEGLGFVCLLLSILMCCLPTELIVFCFKYFPILPSTPHPPAHRCCDRRKGRYPGQGRRARGTAEGGSC
mgnify:CR=1 FL=1